MDEKMKVLMLEDLPDDVGLIERVLRKENISFIGKTTEKGTTYTHVYWRESPTVILL